MTLSAKYQPLMSLKLSSVARFFSREPSNIRKDEKSDSRNSSSKIARFFHKLFHSKKNARQGVDAAFQRKNNSDHVRTHVKKDQSNKSTLVDINHMSTITGDPKYFVMLDEITTAPPKPAGSKTELNQRPSDASNPNLNKSNLKDDRTVSISPEARYAELDQRRNFIDSNEGRFMLDIVSMGTCIEKPQQHFRALPGLDLQKTLANAFQIYYEEGKLIHEESFATPGWGYEPTAQSTTDLKNLKANLGTISAQRENEQALIQKAIGAIEGRIDRITKSGEK
jgi:hypothetical protein